MKLRFNKKRFVKPYNELVKIDYENVVVWIMSIYLRLGEFIILYVFLLIPLLIYSIDVKKMRLKKKNE